MYKVKINGVTHSVEIDSKGRRKYDPPLPRHELKKYAANIRDICESRQCPGLQTDTSFHAGRGTLLDQMEGDEVWCKYLVQEAKKQGYTPGANDVYISQIADKPGDKKAWIKPGEGRADVMKRVRDAGKGIDAPGMRVDAKPYEEKKFPKLNKKVVDRFERSYRANGMDNGMSRQELRNHIVAEHGKKDI